MRFRDSEVLPAGLVELLPCLPKAAGRLDLACFQPTPGAVGGRVQWARDLLGEPIDLSDHHVDLVAAPRAERRLAEKIVETELLKQEETELPKIGLVLICRLAHG